MVSDIKTLSFVPAVDLQTKQPCEIHLTPQDRSGGVYILGLPRSGKTTLLINMMLQDAHNDMGFLFIDPHGDAAYDVLGRLPAHRRKDVIFIDPTDEKYSFSINLFECKNPSSTKEVSRVISSVQQVFSKLFIPEGETAITLETTLLNLTILLVYNQGYTLADAALLLEEKDILQKLVDNIDRRRHFNNYRWWQRYIGMKKQDSDKEILSTIRRLLIFTTDEFVRHIVAQTKSTLDFREIIDNKKIVLVRLQREFEELSRLTGALIIDRLLQAVYARDDTAMAKRPYYGLYCDEFQNYATADMAKLFTQTGKYHLLPTLAHQERTGQLSEKDVVVGATLAAPHKILFTVSDYDAKTFASTFALASPAGEPIKEQVTARQYESETVITWEPPESEKYYQTEMKRLEDKRENAFLRAAILYTAVFGPIKSILYESLTFHNMEMSLPPLLEKIADINNFYSIETYQKTGSFVIPTTHTYVTSKYHPGGEANGSAWTERKTHEYKLDPLNNLLVKAFTPTMPYELNFPFTSFLKRLEKPIDAGEYDYFSLKNNPQIETCILFPYNTHNIQNYRELEKNSEGRYIVEAPDNTRSKTIRATREIWTAFYSATSKHKDKVQYTQECQYFKEGAYWYLLACQELAKQIVSLKKELEEFTINYPPQHRKTTVFKRDTGIDVPVTKFIGYRSSVWYPGGEVPSEPEYQPMYTYKPGKPMFSPLEMEKYMEGELANIPRYSAYAKFAHDVNGVQQIDKVKITPPDMPPPPPPKILMWIINATRDNTRQKYCTPRDDIEEELFTRIDSLLEKPTGLPQESEREQETPKPTQPKTLPQESEPNDNKEVPKKPIPPKKKPTQGKNNDDKKQD